MLQQAIADMDNRPMDPKSYNALDSYKRQLQHTNTTEKLLNQKRDILRQQQATGATPAQLQQTEIDIKALEKKLVREQQKLHTAEQNPALQKVIDKTRTGMQNTQSVENSRENTLEIPRTYGRIKNDSVAKQDAVNQAQNATAQNETLTAQDLLDRIGEFVDINTLSDSQRKTLDAYNQQKQLLSDLEESRQTHENPAELDRQIAKAREKLQKIQERKVTKSVVNRVKQQIYREYVNANTEKIQLQDILRTQKEVLTGLIAQLNEAYVEENVLEKATIQRRIEEQKNLLEDLTHDLQVSIKHLTETKTIASAIIDASDRGALLFDDKNVISVNGKRVVIDGWFDLDIIDEEGRTNRQRLEQGRAPINAEGKRFNIHHVDQTDNGIVLVIPESLHQKYDSVLHMNKGQVPTQIDRRAFNRWRESFWKWVFQQQNEQNEQLEESYELSGFSESNGIGTEV